MENQLNSTRQWLEGEITRRVERNRSYSLRAFAKQVGLSPSYLSRVLSGKRGFSFKAATSVSDSLGLDPIERKALFDLVIKEQKVPSSTDSVDHDEALKLSVDAFAIISDWYHYGITQLMYVEGFKEDANWIAKMLDITAVEALMAVERLKRLEIIAYDDEGKLYRTAASLATTDGVYSAGLRKFHQQILEKAIISLEKDPIEERSITSITVAIDESNINRAKEEITRFRKRLSDKMSKGKKTRVYNLGIHLIPLSRKGE